MNQRLKQIIEAKTNGCQRDFCELMGWTPQYLHNILTQGGFGIKPVKSVLERFKDIDARWLITGEGNMYGKNHEQALRNKLYDRIEKIMMYGRYVPVMPEEQQEKLAEYVLSGTPMNITSDEMAEMEQQLSEYTEAERLVELAKTVSVCSHKKA